MVYFSLNYECYVTLEYSRMDLGTMLQGAGSSATARRRAIAGILPAGFTVANCLLRPCASRTPAPTLCHPFIFFNGILEMVFFIRLSMALLIRLIMALFTRPKIGLFHPTLTSSLSKQQIGHPHSLVKCSPAPVQFI